MIKGKLYIESFEESNDFDVNDSYYVDENAYIKALQDEYELSNSLLSSIGGVGVDRRCDINTIYEKNKKVIYNSCECVLKDESIDSFISHNIDGRGFQLLVSLDLSNIDEDFEYDLKLWREVHNKTFSMLSKNNDMDVLMSELPSRDLKMSFINLSGGNSYALLEGCTFVDSNNDLSNILLFVNKLTFTKGIE